MKTFVVRFLLLFGILLLAGTGRVVESYIATFVLDSLACILVFVFGQTMVNEELGKTNKKRNEYENH